MLFLLGFTIPTCTFGKALNSDSLSLRAMVLGASTQQPIPYAAVVHLSKQRGTISDKDGFFKLDGIGFGDTLQISFIGYNTEQYVIRESKGEERIYLQPKRELLGEVLVLADDAFLYDLIYHSTKTQAQKQRTAKSYYTLESSIDQKQIELVECYYNGLYTGYDLNELLLKNGRLALAEYNQRFFVSTESSRAMSMHRLFDKNYFFPTSPFELNRRQLKRKYDLTLISRYRENDSTTVYVLDFVPIKNPEEHFQGRVWIDSADNSLLKVKLQIDQAATHPFLPMGNALTIESVRMELVKSFVEVEGTPYLGSMHFNYKVDYRTLRDTTIRVEVSALLQAFNYDESFVLPRFEFNSGGYVDYRKISASPYNAFFWRNMKEFAMREQADKNARFIEEEATYTNRDFFSKNELFERGFFEHPYVYWSRDRVAFREMKMDTVQKGQLRGALPSDLYHLEAQIYLDFNQAGDTLHFITRTIFDPFKSFYYYPIDRYSTAFINLYFDLMEVERRKLNAELLQIHSPAEMTAHYEQFRQELDKRMDRFFSEVNRGNDEEGMRKWNEVVKRELEIDNVALYQLFEVK